MQQSISQVVSEYLRNHHKRLAWNTIELTRRSFRYFIDVVGDIPVNQVDFSAVEKFQTWLLDGRNNVSTTIFKKQASPVFNWAVRKGYLDKNPIKDLTKLKIPKQRIRVYEQWEFDAMMEQVGPLWAVRLLLAKTAGLRRGECLNLNFVDDIDFGRRILYVQPKKECSTTWRWTPKNTDVRALPLCERTEQVIVRLIELLPEGQPYLCLTSKRYRTLQAYRKAGKMHPRSRVTPDENFAKPFERLRKRAGVKYGTFHDLRKTCITEWLENGLQPHEVQRLAGHASVETTMKYYTAIRTDLLDKARAASQKVFGATGLEPATS